MKNSKPIKVKIFLKPVTVTTFENEDIKIALCLASQAPYWTTKVNFIIKAGDKRTEKILNTLSISKSSEKDGLKIYESNLNIEGAIYFLNNRKRPIQVDLND